MVGTKSFKILSIRVNRTPDPGSGIVCRVMSFFNFAVIGSFQTGLKKKLPIFTEILENSFKLKSNMSYIVFMWKEMWNNIYNRELWPTGIYPNQIYPVGLSISYTNTLMPLLTMSTANLKWYTNFFFNLHSFLAQEPAKSYLDSPHLPSPHFSSSC